MATRKNYLLARTNYLNNLTQTIDNDPMNSDSLFEFEESDLWNHSNQTPPMSEPKKPMQSSRLSKKLSKMMIGGAPTPTPTPTARSLPVNVPDWSKILCEDNGERRMRESDDVFEDFGGDNDDQYDRIPPHEYLARTRRASSSVHEGIGRTLKGRDLRRVRNAIWEKIGFED